MMKPAECEPARQVIDDIRSISTIKVNILVNEAMIISDLEDTHRTIFDPDEELLLLVRELAAGEGMFVWRAEDPAKKDRQ